MKYSNEKLHFLGLGTFDEANYYHGSEFQIGGTMAEKSHDKNIQERARVALEKVDHNLGGIQVLVRNGVIRLQGKVDHFIDRRLVETMLEPIPGVRDIINELQVLHLKR